MRFVVTGERERVDRDERLERALIGPDATLGQALRAMSDSGARISFVVDPERRLLGVLTDGDVRRWIIGGRGLDEPVASAMNTTPVTLPAGEAPEAARAIMVERRIECIPLLHADGRIAGALWWLDLFEEPRAEREQLGMPVVIMAGGQGSRLAPLTTILPKPLVPIGDRTILERIMERFVAYGCDRFHVSVNYKANLIRAYLADLEVPYDVRFVEEPEPLGTAGSLSLLKGAIDSTFFLTNCDIVVDADYADVVRYHREHANRITLVASAKHFTIPYGVCETSEGGTLVEMREKPQFDFLVSTGFYVVERSVLDGIADGEFAHMTDVINRYLDAGERVGVYPVSEDAWVDIGEIETLRETLARFGA